MKEWKTEYAATKSELTSMLNHLSKNGWDILTVIYNLNLFLVVAFKEKQ